MSRHIFCHNKKERALGKSTFPFLLYQIDGPFPILCEPVVCLSVELLLELCGARGHTLEIVSFTNQHSPCFPCILLSFPPLMDRDTHLTSHPCTYAHMLASCSFGCPLFILCRLLVGQAQRISKGQAAGRSRIRTTHHHTPLALSQTTISPSLTTYTHTYKHTHRPSASLSSSSSSFHPARSLLHGLHLNLNRNQANTHTHTKQEKCQHPPTPPPSPLISPPSMTTSPPLPPPLLLLLPPPQTPGPPT